MPPLNIHSREGEFSVSLNESTQAGRKVVTDLSLDFTCAESSMSGRFYIISLIRGG